MGYFAVLSERRDDLEIVRCHLNLWILPGLPFRRVFFFDVGLGIRCKIPNGTQTTAEELVQPKPFKLALPFGVEENGHFDISDKLLNNSDTAMLVFGQRVEVKKDDAGGTISYDNQRTETRKRAFFSLSEIVRDSDGVNAAKVEIDYSDDDKTYEKKESLRVVPASLSKEDLLSTDRASIYNVALPPVARDAEIYVRLRFRVSTIARMWLSNGARCLLDLRIADVREAVQEVAWKELKTRSQVVPIKRLNAFVICPRDLRARAASPVPKYVRLLEGSLWEDYLRRRIGENKLFIYYWKGSDVDDREPIRLLLDLQAERWSAGAGLFIGLLLGIVGPALLPSVKDFLSADILGSLRGKAIALVTTLSAIGIVKFLAPKIGAWGYNLLRNRKTLRRWIMALEDWLYGVRIKGPHE